MIMSSEKNFKIFVDFDGTITKRDVGEAMFLEFGDAAEANIIVKDWIGGKINAAQSWELLCATVKNFDKDRFNLFLNEIEIEPTFFEFVDYCKTKGFEIRILSDGLDYYISRILEKNSLSHIEVYSNKLYVDGDNRLIPLFPTTDEECRRCANCKRNHVLNFSSDDDYSVYIGDGYSDTCPAQFCDFIFAKHSLLKYCETNRITFFPYKNFNDVKERLEQLGSKKRIKKRYQAQLKRNEVYVQG